MDYSKMFKAGDKVLFKNTDFDSMHKFCPCMVKEIYSDHIIITDTETDTDLWVEDEFNLDYVISPNGTYEYECNISKNISGKNYDEWGAAFIWLDDIGVEYNFCIDSGTNCSAIYKTQIGLSGYMETDYDTFEHYEVDFNDKNWEQNLKNAMIEALKKFYF